MQLCWCNNLRGYPCLRSSVRYIPYHTLINVCCRFLTTFPINSTSCFDPSCLGAAQMDSPAIWSHLVLCKVIKLISGANRMSSSIIQPASPCMHHKWRLWRVYNVSVWRADIIRVGIDYAAIHQHHILMYFLSLVVCQGILFLSTAAGFYGGAMVGKWYQKVAYLFRNGK